MSVRSRPYRALCDGPALKIPADPGINAVAHGFDERISLACSAFFDSVSCVFVAQCDRGRLYLANGSGQPHPTLSGCGIVYVVKFHGLPDAPSKLLARLNLGYNER